MALPSDIETRVVAKLFADASSVGWGDLSVQERATQYGKWVADPEIGGLLTKFMTPERARVWIKDGPMKEWARAMSGVGKYAPMVAQPAGNPESLVSKALGSEWKVVDDSLRIKPLRVLAANNGTTVTFTWGPERDFKHLVWAALQAGANGDASEWVLCIVATFTKPVPANVAQAQQRIAQRCQLRLVHVSG
jgi:hypothetical protein